MNTSLKFLTTKPLGIFVLYIFVAVIFTYPLIWHLADSVIGTQGRDAYQYAWNIYNFWHQISQHKNPFYTNQMFFPFGANLIFDTYAPLISLLGFFFRSQLIFFLNLLVILSLAFGALALYLLAFCLTKKRAASIIAGLIYGFSPINISFAISEHYYFVYASPLLPLGLFMLVRFLSSLKIRYLALIILIFWICFFIDFYTSVIYSVLILISFLSFLAISFLKKDRNIGKFLKVFFSKQLVINFLLGFILPAGLLIYFLESQGFPLNSLASNTYYSGYCNANLAGFIIPGIFNPFLSGLSRFLIMLFYYPVNADTYSYYFGIIFIMFNILAVKQFFKDKYFASIQLAGLVILILSLGSFINFGDWEIVPWKFTPFYWFSRLPFMNLIDCPVRFPIGYQIVIALGVSYLLSTLNFSKNTIIYIFIFLVFIFDYSSVMPLFRLEVPKVIFDLSKISDNRSLLELPSGIAESKNSFGANHDTKESWDSEQYWQTIHKKPRVGGYLSRLPREFYQYYQSQPILADIFTLTNNHYELSKGKLIKKDGYWPGKTYSLKERIDFFKKYNLGFILVIPTSNSGEYNRRVEELLSGIPYSKNAEEGYILYRLDK